MDAPPIEGPETTTEPVDTQKDMSEPPPRDMSQARDTFEGFEDTPDDSGSVPCWETGTTSNPSCREPTSCPAPDKSRKPQITCYTPHWTSEFEDFTLDIYGKHLVNENGPPEQVIYRDDQTTGPAGRTNDNIEVISDCHIRVTLYIRSSTILSCGRTLEFRLQREDVSLGEFDAGFRGNPSDWHTVRITK